jgi:hypothetical protein
MDDLSLLLSIIGFLSFLVFLGIGIVSLIRKSERKKEFFKYAGISFASMLVFFIVFGFTADDTTKETKTVAKNEYDEKEKREKTDPYAKKKTNKEAKEVTTGGEKAKPDEDEETEVEVPKTPQQQIVDNIMGLIDTKQAFDSGSYIKGEIPVGEYAFISFNESGKYYSEKDTAGNIIDNENFDSFGYVYVHDVGNIETQGVLINIAAFKTLGVTSAKEIYETMNNVQNYKESAWYKVGVDIQPGQYVIESYGEGYVGIMAGPVGKSDIVDNEIFNGKHMVTVSAGQYLKVSRGVISQ